jgi:hypothetical protein
MLDLLTYMVAGVGALAAICLLYVVKEIYSTNTFR